MCRVCLLGHLLIYRWRPVWPLNVLIESGGTKKQINVVQRDGDTPNHAVVVRPPKPRYGAVVADSTVVCPHVTVAVRTSNAQQHMNLSVHISHCVFLSNRHNSRDGLESRCL